MSVSSLSLSSALSTSTTTTISAGTTKATTKTINASTGEVVSLSTSTKTIPNNAVTLEKEQTGQAQSNNISKAKNIASSLDRNVGTKIDVTA